MAISAPKPDCRPVICSVPQESIVVPVPHQTFTNGLDGGAEHPLSRNADAADLGGVADMQEG